MSGNKLRGMKATQVCFWCWWWWRGNYNDAPFDCHRYGNNVFRPSCADPKRS